MCARQRVGAGGGGWWRSRAGENAVCKAGGEFKRSCAERMASPRATLSRFLSPFPPSCFAHVRAAASLDATPAPTQVCTRQREKRGRAKERRTERGSVGVRMRGREGGRETEARAEGARGGKREREKKRHGRREARTKTERVTALWLPLTFPHPFSHLSPPWHTCTQRNYVLLSHHNSRCAGTSSPAGAGPGGRGTRDESPTHRGKRATEDHHGETATSTALLERRPRRFPPGFE